MSADFQISLPPWPMARVLKEASAHWNLLHPDNLADPEESDWRLLCNVVHSFLRHQQTQHEQVLAAGTDREELHDRISRAASRFFPWFKVERDPRTSAEAEEKPEDYRPFNDFSWRLSDLVSERSRFTVAIKDARRKRLGREHIAELEVRNVLWPAYETPEWSRRASPLIPTVRTLFPLPATRSLIVCSGCRQISSVPETSCSWTRPISPHSSVARTVYETSGGIC
jgi:hypothetical protein